MDTLLTDYSCRVWPDRMSNESHVALGLTNSCVAELSTWTIPYGDVEPWDAPCGDVEHLGELHDDGEPARESP